jgi:competence protein ComEA
VWGRELRAGLVFVLVSVALGGAFRAWERGHAERLGDIVAALAEGEAAALRAPAAGSPDPALPGASAGGGSSPEPAPAGSSPGGGRSARARRPDAAPPRPASIDVDRATGEEWLRLPGIGPSLASRIVADRAARGPFGGPDGLLRVPGIGPKTLAKIRVYLAPVSDSIAPGAPPAGSDRAK